MQKTRRPETSPIEPLLMSFQDAALVMGVGKDYIYKMVDAGEIAYIQLGTEKKSRRRITREALEDFIRTRTEQAQS